MLPYCSDKTHPDDALFIVVEPDFCCREEDEQARREWQEALLEESFQLDKEDHLPDLIDDESVRERFLVDQRNYNAKAEGTYKVEEVLWPLQSSSASGSGDTAPPNPNAKPSVGRGNDEASPSQSQQKSYWGEREVEAPVKPTKEPGILGTNECSQELLDIIYICNVAKRNCLLYTSPSPRD